MIQPWPLVDSRVVGDFHIFQLRQDRKTSPRNGQTHGFYVLDSADWVNVLALTPQGELVMVEQYRHGTNTVELEVPGGIMDPTDTSPVVAGLRELREETGYEGRDARLLADLRPNPAIMSNTCHVVCVQHCEKRHDLKLDHAEDVATRLVPVADLPQWVAEGRIRHAIVLVSLYYLELWQRGLKA